MSTVTFQYYSAGWVSPGSSVTLTRFKKEKVLKRHIYQYPEGGTETKEIGYQWRYSLSWDHLSSTERTTLRTYLERLLYGTRVRISKIDSTTEEVEVVLESDSYTEKMIEYFDRYPIEIVLISTALTVHANPAGGGAS